MRIEFSPVRMDGPFEVDRQGSVLTINGVAYDMSIATIETCPWLADPVETQGATLRVTLIRPHGSRAGHAERFPVGVTVPGNGRVPVEM